MLALLIIVTAMVASRIDSRSVSGVHISICPLVTAKDMPYLHRPRHREIRFYPAMDIILFRSRIPVPKETERLLVREIRILAEVLCNTCIGTVPKHRKTNIGHAAGVASGGSMRRQLHGLWITTSVSFSGLPQSSSPPYLTY